MLAVNRDVRVTGIPQSFTTCWRRTGHRERFASGGAHTYGFVGLARRRVLFSDPSAYKVVEPRTGRVRATHLAGPAFDTVLDEPILIADGRVVYGQRTGVAESRIGRIVVDRPGGAVRQVSSGQTIDEGSVHVDDVENLHPTVR